LSVSATAKDSLVASFSCADEETSSRVTTALDLLCEGRCSLATSLASYKLLVIYGLLFSVIKLASFYYAVLMPILGYIMIDVVALVPLTFLVTLARPLRELKPRRPTSSLLGPQTCGSIVSFMACFLCAMAANLSMMRSNADYVRWPSHVANTAAWWYISDNWESSTLWVTCFLFFACSSLIFSFGADFRRPAYTNWQLVVYVSLMLIITVVVFLCPINSLSVAFHAPSEQFNRVNTQNPIWKTYQSQGGATSPAMSFDLRFSIFVIAVVFVLLAAAIERYVVYGNLFRGRKSA
jgi:magnesium-transporting ATPase (P-type)